MGIKILAFFRQKWVKWVRYLLFAIVFIIVVIIRLTNQWLDFEGRNSISLTNLIVEYPTGLPYTVDSPQKVVLTKNMTNTKPLIVAVELSEGIVLSPTTTYIGDNFEVIFPVESRQKAFYIQNDLHNKGFCCWRKGWSPSSSITFTVKQTAQISQSQSQPISASVAINVQTGWGHTIYQFLTNDVKKNSPIIILITALIALGSWYWKEQKKQREKEQEQRKKEQEQRKKESIRKELGELKKYLQSGQIQDAKSAWDYKKHHFQNITEPNEWETLEILFGIINKKSQPDKITSLPIIFPSETIGTLTYLWENTNKKPTRQFYAAIHHFDTYPLDSETQAKLDILQKEFDDRVPQPAHQFGYIINHFATITEAENLPDKENNAVNNMYDQITQPPFKPQILVIDRNEVKESLISMIARHKFSQSDDTIFLPYYAQINSLNKETLFIQYVVASGFLQFLMANPLKLCYIDNDILLHQLYPILRDTIKITVSYTIKEKKNEIKNENDQQSYEIPPVQTELIYLNKLYTDVMQFSLSQQHLPAYQWLDNVPLLLESMNFKYYILLLNVPENTKLKDIDFILQEIPYLEYHRIITYLMLPNGLLDAYQESKYTFGVKLLDNNALSAKET